MNICDIMYIHFPKDTLQKLSLIAFSQAMLTMMGDKRKVVGFYPTELIIPTFRKKLMDGVLELDDGTLINIEFQTGNLNEVFLLRCAQYAVNLRVVSGKYVETKIISTGSKDKSKTEVFISNIFPFKPELHFYSELNGLEKLINIKNKIKNKEKLTLTDGYNLIFIPMMGNVNKIKAAFEVFKIANEKGLFSEDKQSEIKQCQYVVAKIVAGDNEELFNNFWEIIKMNNDFLVKYENDLIEKTTKEVTEKVTQQVTQEVTEKVSKNIAKNLKNIHTDIEISKYTGLSIEEIKKL